MRINEIFYSLQGEGAFTGTPAIFVRFAGCNLRCPFCDTEFESYTEMSVDDIINEISKIRQENNCWPNTVVLTGGEPTLQITTELLTRLNDDDNRCNVHIETNGTKQLPEGPIHWVTCSPKHASLYIQRIDELKVVYQGQDMSQYDDIKAKVYSLQPCDTGDPIKNQEILQKTINYILHHPKWKLSLQTHKIINVK